MPPPGQQAAIPAGGSTRTGSQIELAIRAAHRALATLGVQVSPRKVNRIVRRFATNAKANGLTFHQFLGEEANLTPVQRRQILGDSDLARAIAYMDPTGDTAVRNVMRRGGAT